VLLGPPPKREKKGPTEYKISDGIYMESREKRRGKTDNSRNRRRKKKIFQQKELLNCRSAAAAPVR
jgi:hypothetical protein